MKRKIIAWLWVILLFAIVMSNTLAASAQSATIYPIPWPVSGAIDIAVVGGLGGYKVWFTEQLANKLCLFLPAASQIIEYAVPTAGSGPNYLEVDSKGNVWFTEAWAGKLAMFDPVSQTFYEYKLPMGYWPGGVAIDWQDNVWFTVWGGDYIVKCIPNPTQPLFIYHWFPGLTPNRGFNRIITYGKWDIWFTESEVNKIANLNFQWWPWLVEYDVPTVYAGPKWGKTYPYDIAAGRKGCIWFGEWDAGKVAAFVPAHGIGGGIQGYVPDSIVEYTVPPSVMGPVQVAGIDFEKSTDEVWFVDVYAKRVCVLDPLTATGVMTLATGVGYEVSQLDRFPDTMIVSVTGVPISVPSTIITPTMTPIAAGITEYDLSPLLPAQTHLYNIATRPYLGGTSIAWVTDWHANSILSINP